MRNVNNLSKTLQDFEKDSVFFRLKLKELIEVSGIMENGLERGWKPLPACYSTVITLRMFLVRDNDKPVTWNIRDFGNMYWRKLAAPLGTQTKEMRNVNNLSKTLQDFEKDSVFFRLKLKELIEVSGIMENGLERGWKPLPACYSTVITLRMFLVRDNDKPVTWSIRDFGNMCWRKYTLMNWALLIECRCAGK